MSLDLQYIFKQFVSDTDGFEIIKFGTGLIHGTYLVSKKNNPLYILQEINTSVFKSPDTIAANLSSLSDFLNERDKHVFFPVAQKTLLGNSYCIEQGKYYRLTKFVAGSHSIDSCVTSTDAYEAALQFGKFTAAFKDFDVSTIKPTIPQFHDLTFRWKQFLDSLINGNKYRIKFAEKEINQIKQDYHIVEKFEEIKVSTSFKQRVTHHDSKISNVLFNEEGKGVCVIDLDTVMPGYFISDLGDMFRTYLASATEEEVDFSKITARPDFYKALIQGYLENMSDKMTGEEISQIDYAGEFMIYMQALRFLTDFLNDDIYYGTKYELHNYNRTINQLVLLDQFRKIKN
jgi:Ser/Thr protein kinase RdoA (MazF antagonist)